jgi:hypothetical protein
MRPNVAESTGNKNVLVVLFFDYFSSIGILFVSIEFVNF